MSGGDWRLQNMRQYCLPSPARRGVTNNRNSHRETRMSVWKPHVTVAAVLEQEGRFLLVEEEVEGSVVYNQPAGHLEEGESLLEAAVRETLEETGYGFAPEALVGIYRWHKPDSDITYLRVAFSGRITGHDAQRPLDSGIIRPVWFDESDLARHQPQLRSPLVMRCIRDYQAGHRYPLELLSDIR